MFRTETTQTRNLFHDDIRLIRSALQQMEAATDCEHPDLKRLAALRQTFDAVMDMMESDDMKIPSLVLK